MNHFWWYVARAAGLVAWALLTGSVLLGVALSTRIAGRRLSSAWLKEVHQYVGGLSVAFVGVHVAGILLDGYVHFGIGDVLVPLASPWHPVAVAWGVVAMWVLLAVELTSLARARLPAALWRQVHLSSYALFLLATVHLLSAGTDAWSAPVRFLAAAGTAAVAALTAAALLQHRPRPTREAGPAAPVRRAA